MLLESSGGCQPAVTALGCWHSAALGLPGPAVCWMRKLHTWYYSIHLAPSRWLSPWEGSKGLEGGVDSF